MLRRASNDGNRDTSPLTFDGLHIDPATRHVTANARSVVLTQREFDLLLHMASRPGHAFSREDLMKDAWRFPYYSDTTTVTVHIRRLRAEIEPDPAKPTRIETVWGAG